MESFATVVSVVKPETPRPAPVDFDEDLLSFDEEIFLQARQSAIFAQLFTPVAGSSAGGEDFDDEAGVTQGIGSSAVAIVTAHHQVRIAVGSIVDLKLGIGEVDAAVVDVRQQVAEEVNGEIVVGERAASHRERETVSEFVAVFLLRLPVQVFSRSEALGLRCSEHGA